jgi:transposase
MLYPDAVRERMIQKMAGPSAISAGELSRKEGISQATLSKWLRDAGRLGDMKNEQANSRHHRRPQEWSLTEKLRTILELDQLPTDQVGAYLREHGLYEAQVQQWRQAAGDALDDRAMRKNRGKTGKEKKKIKQLEKELRRKDRALAETAALLVLKKKAQAIWGGGDDDTTTETGG